MPPKRNSKKAIIATPAESDSSDDDFERKPTPSVSKKRTQTKQNAANTGDQTKKRKVQGGKKAAAELDSLNKIKASSDELLLKDTSKEEILKKYSIINYLSHQENGTSKLSSQYSFSKVLKSSVIENVTKLAVTQVASPFDRRITALTWHPKLPHTLAVGSKAGDLVLWNCSHPKPDFFIKGSGPGGSINAIKFDVEEENHVYTCSIDGTFCRRDLSRPVNKASVLLDTGERFCDDWYTSLDVCSTGGVLLAGDNKGNVNLLTKNGELVWKKRLHAGKVHHIEFHSREPSLFVSSGLDNCVRLFDVRKIDDRDSCIVSLSHKKGVNSACFSPAYGTRLLTTDQHSELKIFTGPLWNLETSIRQPHRQFQHLTPFKADWHPLEDIVVIGRYPDPKFPGYTPSEPRSVDFFDATDGSLLCQIQPAGHELLMALNKFNPTGRILASAMSSNIVLWKPKYLEAATSSKTTLSARDMFKEASEERKRKAPKNDDDLKKKKSSKSTTSTKSSKK